MSWVSGWKLWGPPVSLSYELINSVVIPVAKLIHFGDKCLGWKWMEMTSDIGDSPSVSQCQAKTEHFLGWKTSPFTQQLFVKKWAIICQQRGIFWDGKPLHLCSNYLSLCCVTEVEECHMDSLHCGLVAFPKIQMWIHDIKSDEGGKAWNWKAPGWMGLNICDNMSNLVESGRCGFLLFSFHFLTNSHFLQKRNNGSSSWIRYGRV